MPKRRIKMDKSITSTPPNLERYTMQVDRALYRRIKAAASRRGLKIFEIINTILFLGSKKYSELLNSRTMKKIFKMNAKGININECKIDTCGSDLKKLKDIIKEVLPLSNTQV